MSQSADPYADPTSLRRIAESYGRGASLDAKWEVMRRHRTSPVNFEDWLLDKLSLEPGIQVLDIGAGSGRFAIPLARRLKQLGGGGSVLAVDVLEGVMDPIRQAVAEEDLPIEITTGDANKVAESLGTFDIVLAAHMLYHLDDIAGSVQHLRDRLKPGGCFVATTNAAAGMPEFFDLHVATMRVLELPYHDGPPPARFTAENGGDLLGQVFKEVQTEIYDGGFTARSADPVFTYWSSTELYRSPMRDESVPFETKMRIAPTFVHLTQEVIDGGDGVLLIRKEMGAFLCR